MFDDKDLLNIPESAMGEVQTEILQGNRCACACVHWRETNESGASNVHSGTVPRSRPGLASSTFASRNPRNTLKSSEKHKYRGRTFNL